MNDDNNLDLRGSIRNLKNIAKTLDAAKFNFNLDAVKIFADKLDDKTIAQRPSPTDLEQLLEKFLRGDKKVPDTFDDEIALILRGKGGLTVVTACAHNGILNIVADVRERFNLPIVNVIGGLHLTGATNERISRTIDELKILGVKKILPCHCSGEDFMKNFAERISTGSVIEIA